jgi:hypothetical protein
MKLNVQVFSVEPSRKPGSDAVAVKMLVETPTGTKSVTVWKKRNDVLPALGSHVGNFEFTERDGRLCAELVSVEAASVRKVA